MNFVVMLFLCDQFDQLNKEFDKCIGDRGEFRGNFEQFRRRHQAVSCTVQEADRFLMFSNGASICCQVVTVILILYSTIFYRFDTIAFDLESTVLYVAWLSSSVFGLLLGAGQAIVLNQSASILCLRPLYRAIQPFSATGKLAYLAHCLLVMIISRAFNRKIFINRLIEQGVD